MSAPIATRLSTGRQLSLASFFAAAAVFMLAGGALLAQVPARVAPGSGELVLASASD